MNYNKQHFCALVSVHAFHQMLFNMDSAFYGRFIQEIKKHAGCGGNIKSVEWLLGELQSTPTKLKMVTDWMTANAPHVIQQEPSIDHKRSKVEVAFAGDIHTIPRRRVIPASQLDAFIPTTIRHEKIQYNDIVYVEYLDESDVGIIDLIGDNRWFLKNL